MKRLLILATGALLMLSACSPNVTVRSDYARGVNFRQYNTFAIEAEPRRNNDAVMGSELNRDRITRALEGELTARGLTRATDGQADLVIRFGTESRDRQSVQSNNTFSPYWMWYGGGMNTSTRNYEENRIIVNAYDARNNRQIWQGWASGQFYDRNKDVERSIFQSVDKIMAQFPLQPDGAAYARQR